MAKILVEDRQFTNRATGEIIPYKFMGIVGVDRSGRIREVNLSKVLDANTKIAFETVAEMNDPEDSGEVHTSRGGEVKTERVEHGSEIDLNSEDEDRGMFD